MQGDDVLFFLLPREFFSFKGSNFFDFIALSSKSVMCLLIDMLEVLCIVWALLLSMVVYFEGALRSHKVWISIGVILVWYVLSIEGHSDDIADVEIILLGDVLACSAISLLEICGSCTITLGWSCIFILNNWYFQRAQMILRSWPVRSCLAVLAEIILVSSTIVQVFHFVFHLTLVEFMCFTQSSSHICRSLWHGWFCYRLDIDGVFLFTHCSCICMCVTGRSIILSAKEYVLGILDLLQLRFTLLIRLCFSNLLNFIACLFDQSIIALRFTWLSLTNSIVTVLSCMFV